MVSECRSGSPRWKPSFASTRRSAPRIGPRVRAVVSGPGGSTASTMPKPYWATRPAPSTSWTEGLIQRDLRRTGRAQRSFVIRALHDRVLAGHDEAHLRAAARSAQALLRREVPLTATGEAWAAREATPGPAPSDRTIERRRPSVEVSRSSDSHAAMSASIPLNLIHVSEPKPPPGQPAVEWFLLTNLPIDTPEEIAFVVDCYRGRWTIEDSSRRSKSAANTSAASSKARPAC